MLQRPVEPDQHTSSQLQQLTTDLNLTSSMRHTRIYYDNALQKSFFSTPKHDFHQRHTRPTRTEARQAITAWNETIYNHKHRHSHSTTNDQPRTNNTNRKQQPTHKPPKQDVPTTRGQPHTAL
ncbi:MAG: hypothetical protein Q4D79_05520 [Propionibacteriaceae bacterium]|nr:hypothetical protein [Propionibacteriaceae bacterium]